MWSASADLIPPVRLGRLLRQRREELGWTLPELASLHGVDIADLDAVEAGVRLLDEGTMALVEAAYGIEHSTILPQRTELVIDIDEGTIAAAEHEIGLEGSNHHDQVLTRYLALVYALRGLPLGAPVTFRDVDLAVLGRALAEETRAVERQLFELVQSYDPDLRDTSRLFRRATVVPLAGLLVGLTAVGGLVLVQRDAGSLASSNPQPADEVGLTLPLEEGVIDGSEVIVGTPPAPTGVLRMADSVEIGEAAVAERPPEYQRDGNAEEGIDIGDAVSLERPDGDGDTD